MKLILKIYILSGSIHYVVIFQGNYFTDIKNTFGAIYIVRDPRNIITSINHHFSHKNITESLKFLFDDNKVLGHSNLKEKKDNHIITPIASWGTHYNSWKILKKNFLLIKYENLLLNPYNEFNIGISNLGWKKYRFLRIDYVLSQVNRKRNEALMFGLSF